jgi:hypothetical protein
VRYNRYWCKDENDAYFVMFQSLKPETYEVSDKNIKLSELEECFVIIPFTNTDQSVVFYISWIDFGGKIYPFVRDKLRVRRMNILLGLREYVQNLSRPKFQIDPNDFSVIYQNQVKKTTISP